MKNNEKIKKNIKIKIIIEKFNLLFKILNYNESN